MKLRARLAAELGLPAEAIQLFYKGRVALWALLRAAGVGEGDEVLLQGFTCVAVPNAILQAGARPIYADISPETYNMTVAEAKARLTPHTKAIVVQNTFGLSTEIEGFRQLCDERRLLLIEDCTHGFGGLYRGRPNGTLCHAAFYSTQWSKPFTSGLGGFAAVTTPELFPRLASLAPPPAGRDLSLLVQNLVFTLIPSRHFLARLKSLYRLLYSRGVIAGSSTPVELEAPPREQDEPWSMGWAQRLFAGLRLSGLRPTVARRIRNGRALHALAVARGARVVPAAGLEDHSFLRFSLESGRRPEVAAHLLRRYGISAGDWFMSPLYPIRNGLEKWGFTPCPNAEAVSARIFNLPTEEDGLAAKLALDKEFWRLVDAKR